MAIFILVFFAVVLLAIAASMLLLGLWATFGKRQDGTTMLGGGVKRLMGVIVTLMGGAIFSFLVYFLYWIFFLSQ